MVCNKCGAFVVQGNEYCSQCGASVIQGPNHSTAGKAHFCKNCGGSIPANFNVCPTCGAIENDVPQQVNIYQQAPVNNNVAPTTTIGQYIGWMLIGYIPVIGWIIAIVLAIDSSNKNRANFFRANILLCLIVVLLATLIGLIFGSSIFFLVESLL